MLAQPNKNWYDWILVFVHLRQPAILTFETSCTLQDRHAPNRVIRLALAPSANINRLPERHPRNKRPEFGDIAPPSAPRVSRSNQGFTVPHTGSKRCFEKGASSKIQ